MNHSALASIAQSGTERRPKFRWLRVRRLQHELAQFSPSSLAQLGYLTLFLFGEIFSWGLDTEIFGFAFNDRLRSYWYSVGIPLFAIKLLGPSLVYIAYRPADPARFLERFFALSGPIRNCALVFLLFGLFPARAVATFLETFFDLPRGTVFAGAGVGLFWLAFSAWHYAWLALAMRSFQRSHPHRSGPAV